MCRSVGVEYTGTVRVDRCGKAFGTATDTKKETKGWEKGTYRGKECVLDGKSFYAFQWQDNKVVTFLSTMKGVEGTITRNPCIIVVVGGGGTSKSSCTFFTSHCSTHTSHT